ncbi:hypothetical protein B5M19_03510 [Mesomycoplasma hyopneumoniae]|uniref:Uncharacterized protein n=2 Tax=Mesomycoplasma hyopneumoniae (strain 168) TaxID=907287 RepID=E4QSW3_MESH1|nr:hypothetical protein [Mesomycoplasma hyopneumoniae]ADQ90517.1 hypothetical protein MHP168_310 [Mesomycoplasma hyopneumoniae 168]AGM22090.1 hypothetical protein MHP168L_310 [Mesomycoplasma hyopneumoniae 168-L]OWY73638.1 hypothetical protein B5M19_03510 [Mesomycoplasma hyopneumoniae]
MKLSHRIKNFFLYGTVFLSVSLAIATPTIIATQRKKADAILFPLIALLANENRVIQLAERNTTDYYFGIGLSGVQYLSYYGGGFFQDKIVWDGIARTKFRYKKLGNWYQRDTADRLRLKVTSWISGIGSPSFEVGGEIKYDGNFSASAGAKIGIDSNGYLINDKTTHNSNYAGLDYEFQGWKYKVTTFGQSAHAWADYGNLSVNISSNSDNYRVEKLSEDIQE